MTQRLPKASQCMSNPGAINFALRSATSAVTRFCYRLASKKEQLLVQETHQLIKLIRENLRAKMLLAKRSCCLLSSSTSSL